MRYRVIEEGDNKDKGSHGGSCNVKACQRERSAFYYNSATDSYYCDSCAVNINEANRQELCTFDQDGDKAAY